MITSESLKMSLQKIFFGADTTKYKYIVPITGGFFVPRVKDKTDHTSTWIGYRVLKITPRTHMFRTNEEVHKPVRVDFRLVGMGPAAETFMLSTLLWENRIDVKDAFEADQEAQVMYDNRNVYTYPIEQEGFSDSLLWVTDMHAMSMIKQGITTVPWFPE